MGRPCEEGKLCCYQEFDYGENCMVCGIDYDGEDCPWIKPWGKKKYNAMRHDISWFAQLSVEEKNEIIKRW